MLASPSALGQQTTEIASVDSSGNQANEDSYDSCISADGRFVAFASWADNLVPGDTNGTNDVFVHDRVTGATERVSVDSSGNQAVWCERPSISGDGRYVAFQSSATNLVPDDTNGMRDIFVHDRQTGTTEIVSVDSSGVQTNDHSQEPVISEDGRFVAFESGATNLVHGGTFGDCIFIHDRQTGVTEVVSVDSLGNEWTGRDPDLSASGRFVAFYSISSIVPPDTNDSTDVFVHDRETGVTEIVSVTSSGLKKNQGSLFPTISGDGRYVTFESQGQFVPDDDDDYFDVFVHDRQTGITEHASAGFPDGDSYRGAAISGDGRYVAFHGRLPWDPTGNALVRDRHTGAVAVVSVDSLGNPTNGSAHDAGISDDGRYVTFISSATNLVPGATNGFKGVFVRDRAGALNYCTPGTSGDDCAVSLLPSGSASSSADSGFVVTAPFAAGQKDGLFIFAQNGKQASPWGNGTSSMCIIPPVKRGGLQAGNGTIGFCDGLVSQDLNALWCPSCPKPNLAPVPGQALQVQFWYRDPTNSSNQPSSLSDAIEVPVSPR
jgi:Tol biopolymer transport system component